MDFEQLPWSNPPPGLCERRRAHGLQSSGPRERDLASLRDEKDCARRKSGGHASILGPPAPRSRASRLGGIRTLSVVPMIRDDELIRRHLHLPAGSSPIYRQADRDGAKLRCASRHRHREYAAAERTAAAYRRSFRIARAADGDIRSTSRSSAVRLANWSRCSRRCWRMRRAFARPQFGTLYRCEGDAFRLAAEIDAPPEYAELLRRRHSPFPPIPGTVLDRAFQTKQVVHVADDAASANPSAPAKLAGARTTLVVPMLKERRIGGCFRHLSRPRCVHLPTSKFRWFRTLPPRR